MPKSGGDPMSVIREQTEGAREGAIGNLDGGGYGDGQELLEPARLGGHVLAGQHTDEQTVHGRSGGGQAAAGTTLLVASHVMDEAERCDELLLILHGRLLARGSANEVRERAGVPDLESAFLELGAAEPAP